ncbi:succinate dehydrogenase / fumarate reductase cytochrome b subunit [Rhizobium sp. SG_E_25_P2]|jgi:succinate dehydrogenase / fumarate reductase, cytochrome b subunit|uniref:succinate dehydrogenase, cytochrome b556 subunit n=1 Tax=Rhizobium sp. SG_E_25_P2 TaxID=2879942 RepID=UPI002473A84F|nr:succinate dehydrogenase, cytochrome b556 subunit [Rhizobium sp. SG_E_25_P2]MDH6267560.1 succinate dehydrogenase / fumarate reductase cytochrome b subunit [Rhizobium sp. SG_E_25_P2]
MANTVKNRPLSPHLQVYKLIPTMMASISHRITGGALFFGTLLVAWWLVAAASGEEYFNQVSWVFGSIIGQLVLFGYTLALVHHLLGGLKHIMWDLGHGFEKHFSTRLAIAHFIASPVITVLLWIVGYAVR